MQHSNYYHIFTVHIQQYFAKALENLPIEETEHFQTGLRKHMAPIMNKSALAVK